MLACKGSRGIGILPDASCPKTKFSSGVRFSLLERMSSVVECYTQEKYDILVIPGGAQGAATISKSAAVQELVREFIKDDKIVGMICAGALFLPEKHAFFAVLFYSFGAVMARKSNCTYRKAPAPTANVPSKC
jgi:putative intracellular protease/amidase